MKTTSSKLKSEKIKKEEEGDVKVINGVKNEGERETYKERQREIIKQRDGDTTQNQKK